MVGPRGASGARAARRGAGGGRAGQGGAAGALAAALALAGCAAQEPASLDGDLELRRLREDAPPFGGARVALAAVALDYPLVRTDTEIEADPSWAPVEIDRERWREELAAALAATAGVPAARVDPQAAATRDDLLAQAIARGDALLCEVALSRYRHEFRGRNGWFWPNAFLWYALWAPAMFVRDEDFGATLTGEARVIDVASEAPLARLPLEVDLALSLDDFERGFDLFGFITAPRNLEADNWAAVQEHLEPFVRREVERALVKGFLAEVGPKLAAAPSTTHALVIDVPRYQAAPAVPGAETARRDGASALAALALSAGVPAKNTVALSGARATRAAIEAELARLGARARAQDTVLVYFAGTGARDAERCYLLPFDAAPGRPLADTALSLHRLGAALGETRAERVVVIADASFAGRPDTPRAFAPGPAAGAGAEARLDPALELQVALPGREVVLLAAAGLDEGAADLAGKGHGLFTFYLLRAVAGEADADKDGVVTLAEAHGHVARLVSAQAGLDGRAQTPALFVGPDKPAKGGPWAPGRRAKDEPAEVAGAIGGAGGGAGAAGPAVVRAGAGASAAGGEPGAASAASGGE